MFGWLNETVKDGVLAGAVAGNPDDMMRLADSAVLNDTVSPEAKENALRWLHCAAESGHPKAMKDLGLALVRGWGMEINEPEGCLWLMRAARQGNVVAHILLAHAYHGGIGVERDGIKCAAHAMIAHQAGVLGEWVVDLCDDLLVMASADLDKAVELATGPLENLIPSALVPAPN